MSKYQAYPEYKDSGVEWLGKIPASWSLSKMAWNFKAEKGKSGQLLTKDYCGLNPGKYAVYSGQTENNGVMGRIDSYEFDTGEEGVLFSTTVGAKAMHLSHLRGKFSLSQNCMIIVPITKRYQIRFSYYHFQPLFYYERGLIPEHMQASFRMEDLYQYPIALPSLKEQELIANFLDYETAKIDTLIDKQQQLIQLLKEKRQAVISHAVTKGLNPNAPMRDSGVEWLGEVPEHWCFGELKFYARVVDCKHITAEFFDEGIPLASISEVKGWCVNLATAKLTNEKYYLDLIDGGRKPQAGDIIYSRNATVGEAALVLENMPDFAMGQDVCLIRLIESYLPEYLLYVLKSGVISNQLDLAMVGSTFKRINVDDIRNFLIPSPLRNEQKDIVKQLGHSLDKYDTLISKAESAIELMQERRTALISAAVTGKIDVRGFNLAHEHKDASA